MRRTFVLSAALGFVPAVAPAQQAGSVGAPEVVLEGVVVTATRSSTAVLGAPASVSVITTKDLEQRKPVRLGDALIDVPGLYVRGAAMGVAYPGSGQAVLSLRGIPRTPRTLVMIDGQPVNNALTGAVDVAGIPLDSIERVEVVRGPYSALYGGAAMGGVINFITAGPDTPLSEIRFGLGSLRQRGAVLVHRQRYENGIGISLSAAYRSSAGDPRSDDVVKRPAAGAGGTPVTGALSTSSADGTPGYRVGTQGARPWRQRAGQLSVYWSPSAATDLVGGIGWADYAVGHSRPESFLRDAGGDAVFAGPVTFSDAGRPTRLSLANTDWLNATPSGERDRRLFARLEHRLEGGGRLKAQVGTLRHDFHFTQGTAGLADYDSGPGTLTNQPNRRIDLDLSLNQPISPDWRLTTGVALNASELDQYTVRLGSWRDPGSASGVLTDGRGSSSNSALYLQSEHALGAGLSVYVGGRYDRFRTHGSVFQAAAPAFDIDYPSRTFSQFSPKVALVWEANRMLTLRMSYGEGFRPPALFDMYGRTEIRLGPVLRIVDAAPLLEPERVRAFEIGAATDLSGGRRAAVSLYTQRLIRLIYSAQTPDSTPTVVRVVAGNAGEAHINGMEANLHWPTMVPGLGAFGAVTHQFRYHIARNDAVPASVGKRLTDVPATSWSAGLDYDAGDWSGLLAARHVGHVFGSADGSNLNQIEGVYGSYDAYTVLSARLGWRMNRQFGLSLSIDNLTDRRYYVFNRQPGRTFYVEVSLRR